MTTLARSRLKIDKNGKRIRIYAVISAYYSVTYVITRKLNSAGFEPYMGEYLVKRLESGVYATIWKLPATVLIDRLIQEVYRSYVAKHNPHTAPPPKHRDDFLRMLEEIEQGKEPTRRKHWDTKHYPG